MFFNGGMYKVSHGYRVGYLQQLIQIAYGDIYMWVKDVDLCGFKRRIYRLIVPMRISIKNMFNEKTKF